MNLGYTKRWRKRWEKGYHKDRLLWVMMSYFIDHANYKDSTVYFPNAGKIPLKRGQHIFGTPQLADFFGANRGRIRRKLKILENMEFLTIKTTNKYSIATVINYDTYQSSESEIDQQNDTHPTIKRPSNDHQTTTPKEYKKVKKVNNTNNRARAWPSDFVLTDKKISYAVSNGLDPNKVGAFFADFKDWSLAKGATYKDWDAAFRTRVRKAEQYGKQFMKIKTYEQEKSNKKLEEFERIMKL